MSQPKPLDVTSMKDILSRPNSDVKVVGNPGQWELLCKASSEAQGWMKSTKAMVIPNCGVIVQVTTQQGQNVAEALVFLPYPNLYLVGDIDGGMRLQSLFSGKLEGDHAASE